MDSRLLSTCSIRKKKREVGELVCFFCSRAALLQRLETLNIKACVGLEIGEEEKEEGGEAART